MKLNKNSLIIRIWKYLIIFSISILLFLWLFQVIFLDKYYEWYKTKSIKKVANEIISNYENSDKFLYKLEDINISEGICIEISNLNDNTYYSSNMNKSCINTSRNISIENAKREFEKSNKKSVIFRVKYREKINYLIYGIMIDSNTYIYLNTFLDPIDSTIVILKNQLLIVTCVVVLLSIIIAYFISRKLSKPITSLSDSAKRFAIGDYNVIFPNTDISEINELSDSLNFAKTELAKTDDLRKDLLANVSHDLKTPLTMIKAYSEMVRDITYKDKKKRTDNLNTIIEEVDRLNLLVSDILDLSMVQSNITKLDLKEVDIILLINSIINRFKIYNLTEDFQFDFIHDKKSIVIKADQQKLEQVIYNLIGNSVNYSSKEKIVIINVIDKNDYIRIEISDRGKGISKEDLPHIWDKYYKVEKKHKRNMVGTGLGLSIVKNILELHNYKYGVNSQKDIGTTFYFEIKKD